jgi:23S rRNA (pseudouridine1915-N3)-methyltransferase
MQCEIWSPGKVMDDIYQAAFKNYQTKLKSWQPVELLTTELTKKNLEQAAALIAAEEELMLKRLKPSDFVILLDERGKLLDNLAWARQMEQCFHMPIKRIVFIIGGAYGVGEGIKKRAQVCWSLSKLVFPHQMVRVILIEQLYRTFSILNNHPYHHL